MRSETVLFVFASAATLVASSSFASISKLHLPQKRDATVKTVGSDHIVQLQRQQSTPVSHAYLEEIRAQTGSEPLSQSAGGQEFIGNITFGTQTFSVIIDTGSSDTWLATTGFQCVSLENQTEPQSECAFGPLYQMDSTLQQIPDENFNISYGDGEYLNGLMAYEDVTLAGITVPHQEVGIVTLAGWEGDGVSSGLVGLAFPSITSAFSGTDADADTLSDEDNYSPIFTTMYETGLVDSVFSVALSRDQSNTSNAGLLAIGGIPSTSDVEGGYNSTFATTPIQILQLEYAESSTSNYSFYTMQIDGISFGATSENTEPHRGGKSSTPWWASFSRETRTATRPDISKVKRQSSSSTIDPYTANIQIIVDTGTTLNYIPSEAALDFNELWSPSAFTSRDPDLEGLYLVYCDATPPPFDVVIDGQTLGTNPIDLVLDAGIGDNVCISGIQDGGGEEGQAVFILGDVWLKNVLAVFDVGNGNLQFASRMDYSS